MALDEDTRRQIEQNRQDALKRLEDRKRRLEIENSTNFNIKTLNLNPSLSVSSLIPTSKRPAETSEIITEAITRNIQRTIPSSFLKPLPSAKLAKTSGSNKSSSLIQSSESTEPKTKSLGSSGIHPIVQLVSPSSFNITATSPVQAICRSIISQVTFNRADNTYTVPLNKYNFILEKLAASEKPQGHQLIPKTVLAAFDSGQIAQRNSAMSIDYRIESAIGSDLYNSLFPYQREGVKMAIARRGRLIIADEMGLGKSIQAIAISIYFRREWPLLILAPASMVASWQQQLLRWIPLEILSPADIQVIYDGKVNSLSGQVIILSYDLAVRLEELIKRKGFRIIIADECHALRNIETKRSKSLIPIISAAERAILLSGTPALSRPIELFPQIQAINSKLFPKRHDYGMRYCDAHKTHFHHGWDMRGSSNLTELQVVLENCIMIRRMKDQVLTELPPKIRRQIFLNIPTATKNYKMFKIQTSEYLGKLGQEQGTEESLVGLESMQKKAEFMALWKRTADVKLSAMIEYIEDLLDANHKMLIFAHHTSIIDEFSEHFFKKKVKYIKIDGRTPPCKRQDICTTFQEDESVRIALLSITAASTGLTLTKATTVIFAELFFNPGILVQAEDRAHRIGQLDSVNVHYLLAKGTTDDHIWPLILKKLNTLESVGLGRNDFKDISSRDHDPGQMTLDRFFKKPTVVENVTNNDDHDLSVQKKLISDEELFFDLTED